MKLGIKLRMASETPNQSSDNFSKRPEFPAFCLVFMGFGLIIDISFNKNIYYEKTVFYCSRYFY
jgi:hypothetical protein